MTDGFPPPDWFPWPEARLSWMPNAPRDGGLGSPALQRNLPARLNFDWEQGPNGGRPNRFGEQFDPYWWESITPAPLDTGTGGLLGHLLAPRDAGTGGLLGNLGTPRGSGGGGLLGDLGARRGGGNGGLLAHSFAPPAGPPAFDRGPDIEGVRPWGWPKLRIPSGLSPTVSPAPLLPPTSSADNWKQDESISPDRGRFNWVETPNSGLLAVHPNGNDVDWVETPSGGLMAVPKPQMDPSWLRSALAVATNAGTSVAPAQPSARPMEIPSYDDPGSAKWDSPALPLPSDSRPPFLFAPSSGSWVDPHRWKTTFEGNARLPRGADATPSEPSISSSQVPPVQFAQALSPLLPPLLFARPPLVPRRLLPLEELPPGSAGGPGAGLPFPRSLGKQEPEGVPCLYCGQPTTREPGPKQFNREHVIPRSRGGNNSPENYVPACRTCNLQKGPRTPEEWYIWFMNGGV